MDFIFEWKQEALDVWNSSQKVEPEQLERPWVNAA